jgi:hypothetical protein
MNAFARHGIEHLSPSSLNLWRDSPGIWALRYLKRIKDEGSAAMWRGTAVENGLAGLLRGVPIDEACTMAEMNFLQNSAGEVSEDIDTERELIAPMVKECSRWQPPSDLNATQIKVEYFFDAVPIPVIGYVDFCFDGIDVDLKTTKACPSSPRPDHIRQVSLYRAARNRKGALLYVTGKRHAPYEITDDMFNGAMADMHNDAVSLYQFLGKFESADDVVRCLPMNRDHFRFPKAKNESLPVNEYVFI